MKKRIALLLIGCVLLGLCACNNSSEAVVDEAQASADTTKETLTIGLSMYTLEYPFYVTMCDAFEAACAENGWNCVTTNAGMDTATQLNDCLDLVNKDVDALVLTSWWGDALEEAFLAANEKNIPVFLIDTAVAPEQGEYLTRIGTSNYDGGYVGGTYVAQYLQSEGKMKVKTVCLIAGDEVSLNRRDGFLDAIKEAGITVDILNEYHSETREGAMANFDDALVTYPEIDLVITGSGQHGMAAYTSAEAAGRTEMRIVGYDGDQEEKDAIDNGTGTYLATVIQDSAEMSRRIASQVGDYLLNGKIPEHEQSLPAGVYTIEGQKTAEELGIQ